MLFCNKLLTRAIISSRDLSQVLFIFHFSTELDWPASSEQLQNSFLSHGNGLGPLPHSAIWPGLDNCVRENNLIRTRLGKKAWSFKQCCTVFTSSKSLWHYHDPVLFSRAHSCLEILSSTVVAAGQRACQSFTNIHDKAADCHGLSVFCSGNHQILTCDARNSDCYGYFPKVTGHIFAQKFNRWLLCMFDNTPIADAASLRWFAWVKYAHALPVEAMSQKLTIWGKPESLLALIDSYQWRGTQAAAQCEALPDYFVR